MRYVPRVEVHSCDEVRVGKDPQTLGHADVPEADGLVHGGAQKELRLGPGEVENVCLVALQLAVGRVFKEVLHDTGGGSAAPAGGVSAPDLQRGAPR